MEFEASVIAMSGLFSNDLGDADSIVEFQLFKFNMMLGQVFMKSLVRLFLDNFFLICEMIIYLKKKKS